MSSSSSAAATKPLEGSKVSTSSNLFHLPAERSLVLCLLLAVMVLAAYNPITHNGFLNYDDNGYITSNPQVKAGLKWSTVKWAFGTYAKANWHPLTWISHALDCQLFGLNPAGHHYMSVLLHAMNAIILFLLLQSATGSRWRSLMVAALFALHPINVESVAWAAERKNVLSMLFFLLALYAYGWYARRPGFGRYSAVAGLFVLALLSKPQVITFPFLLMLWDYWPLNRIENRVEDRVEIPSQALTPQAAQATRTMNIPKRPQPWLIAEKLPLLLLAAASAAITMRAQKAGLAVRTFSEYSFSLRLETAVISYVRYLGKALWPSKLVGMYPHPSKLYPAWQLAAAATLLVVITALVLRARNQRYLVVGWFWFLGSMVPMIGLVQVGAQAMADRYAYIPFIGLFLIFTWMVADWAGSHKISVRWLALAGASSLLALGILTHRQVGYWHDSETFWRHTLAFTEDNYVAEVNLGDALFAQGRSQEAAEQFRAALALYPNGLDANLNMGAYEDSQGNLPAAIARYELVALKTSDVNMRVAACNNLGFDYRSLGDMTKAKQYFTMALQSSPDSGRAMTGLGLIAEANGDLPEAVRQYSHALAVQPTDVGYLLLVQALRLQGRSAEANELFDHVARSSPNLADAQKAAHDFLVGK